MLILSGPNKSIEVVLAGAVATTQLPIVASWVDVVTADQSVFAFGSSDLTTSGATAVTVVAAPQAGHTRTVKSMSIYNADTTGATGTVRLNNGISTRILVRIALATGSTLEYVE